MCRALENTRPPAAWCWHRAAQPVGFGNPLVDRSRGVLDRFSGRLAIQALEAVGIASAARLWRRVAEHGRPRPRGREFL